MGSLDEAEGALLGGDGDAGDAEERGAPPEVEVAEAPGGVPGRPRADPRTASCCVLLCALGVASYAVGWWRSWVVADLTVGFKNRGESHEVHLRAGLVVRALGCGGGST